MVRAYVLSPAGRKPIPGVLAVAAVLSAAMMILLLPGAIDSASLWAPLIDLFPESAPSCFALACASLVGCVAWQAAEAVAQRQPLRPVLTAAIATALLAPAMLAVPLWPALLAAAGLIAVPMPVRLRAANDNPAREPRTPFSLAA